jgi:hypothetical protein
MQTTSNVIECLNGHLNEVTPRYKKFWPAMHRLVEMFTRKIANCAQRFRYNILCEMRRALRRCRAVPYDRMEREIGFFETTLESCRCGETCLAERMYRMEGRCSHHLALEPVPPVIPSPAPLRLPVGVRPEEARDLIGVCAPGLVFTEHLKLTQTTFLVHGRVIRW